MIRASLSSASSVGDMIGAAALPRPLRRDAADLALAECALAWPIANGDVCPPRWRP